MKEKVVFRQEDDGDSKELSGLEPGARWLSLFPVNASNGHMRAYDEVSCLKIEAELTSDELKWKVRQCLLLQLAFKLI